MILGDSICILRYKYIPEHNPVFVCNIVWFVRWIAHTHETLYFSHRLHPLSLESYIYIYVNIYSRGTFAFVCRSDDDNYNTVVAYNSRETERQRDRK